MGQFEIIAVFHIFRDQVLHQKLFHGQKHPDLSLHSYHYVPQNHAIFDSRPHLLATITLSPTGS